ncbi:MAG: ribosomal protein S6--L-glutamate ligase [Bacteroidia bacterium]|jgi:ribosomal protein S6--L-glutamate ligase
MVWISFDVFRSLGFADTLQVKPEQVFQYKAEISKAQWVLFPPYWQLNALQYGLKARIFPSEASYRLGHNKVEMTRAFELVAPHNTPDTWILANTPSNAERLWQDMITPFVAKLPKASQGDGVWLIDSRQEWLDYVALGDTLYVQEYLPIDRDIRIIVIGDKVLAAYWRQQAARGFYNNVAKGGLADHSPVPQAAIALALELAQSLDVNHAGFDIAMVGDRPFVLEFNRLFGNQGISGGDASIRDAIFDYLQREGAPATPNFPSGPEKTRRRLRRVA